MDAIVVEHVSKTFRTLTIPKRASLKHVFVNLNIFNRARTQKRIVTAVQDVSFSVPRGGSLGIVGRNGSGKSTLMRLLAGIYRPDRGVIRIAGNVAPLLSLGVGFHPDFSGRENIKLYGLILGLTPREIDEKFDEIVAFSELSDAIDVPVRTYSSGMYMRLAFSTAVSVSPDVLLLDEVLAVGDEAFARKCLGRMRKFKEDGKTIVLVTHDMNAIVEWCEHAVWMDGGVARAQGPAAEVVSAYHAIMPHRNDAALA